jgi:hypothetical protein
VRHNELYVELERNRMSLQTLLADTQRASLPGEPLRREPPATQDLRDKQFAVANLQQEVEQKKYAYDTYSSRKRRASPRR